MTLHRDVPAELHVLLGGRVAGTLRRGATPGTHIFEYDATWRADPAAYPLSLSLPLAGRVHTGPALTRYLRGLLSDNPRTVGELAHRYNVPADDPYGLLGWIGEDCPGAVQFVRPERLSEVEGAGPGRVEWLDENEVAALLRSLAPGGSGEAGEPGRFSLPGALPKVALVWDADARRWGKPAGRAASTHILKPPLGSVPHHNDNEHLCLGLAREVGLRAASSRVLRIEGERAIAVRRYDRIERDGLVARLHQEDMAQALGVDPTLRYAGQGAPGMADVVGVLRDHAARSADDVARFISAVALNWIIAGTDAHARNYSLLIGPGGDVALAPLYDLASSLLLAKSRVKVPDMNMAMSVNGATALGLITRDSWETQARAVRVRPDRVVEQIADLVERTPEAARRVAERGATEGLDERFAARFAEKIGARARVLSATLTR